MDKFVALTLVSTCLLADSYRGVDAQIPPSPAYDDQSGLPSSTTAKIDTTTTANGISPTTANAAIPLTISFIAAACILVAVVLIMRKRKHDRENERSATTPAIGPPECTVLPGDTSIYAEVALTQRPTYSNNTIGSSVQSAGRAVDMGHNVLYAEIDLPPSKDQSSLKKGTEYLCPIYSEPYETPATDNSTLYAEPFNPVKTPKAALPARNQLATAAAGQRDIYSLAKAIPTSDPKAIYTELTKL